jgi:hypothetical protein
MAHDTTNAQHGAAPISGDQFTQADPRRLYARMRPDQRTAIAGEFLRLFRLSGDPEALRFDKPIEGMLPPERVAELHAYARQHHPEILEQVREHPVTQAALAAPGAEVEEPAEHEEVVVREGGDVAAEAHWPQDIASDPETAANRGIADRGADVFSQPLAPPDTQGGHVPEDTTAGATDVTTGPVDHPEQR